MLVLYFAPGSSSMATHIALHEIGVPFEAAGVLPQEGAAAARYLAVNPEGKVPTLVIDGRPLTEVAGTLYYLAKGYPEAELLPQGGIVAEAQAVSWMSFIASTVHPARRAGTSDGGRFSASARSGWAGAIGRPAAAIRSPTSTCSACYWRFVERARLPTARLIRPLPPLRPDDGSSRGKKTIEIENNAGYEFPR